ncbi:DUF5615 family PIN-like protein [Membranihabitans maritimus]|uniref:DUF5615 family PIN-like protein n=1 Tax=Membranihabitans maritimus TaxID=2904244 RepID=UPI0034E2CF85
MSYKLSRSLDTDFPKSTHLLDALTVFVNNQEVWDYPKDNGYVILTKDRDFDELSQLFLIPIRWKKNKIF